MLDYLFTQILTILSKTSYPPSVILAAAEETKNGELEAPQKLALGYLHLISSNNPYKELTCVDGHFLLLMPGII